jgi:hypothetical protein
MRPLYTTTSDYLNYRISHEKLINNYKSLSDTICERLKRPIPRDEDLDSSVPASPLATVALSTVATTIVTLSCSDYPRIRFWMQREWTTYKSSINNSSHPEKASSPRGGSRASLGENVRLIYIDHEDGMPIDSDTAIAMRRLARSIWSSFYSCGIAPVKWGDATKEVRDEFFREMEARWPVLRYCDSNWKTNHIATLNYPQWYKEFCKKMRSGHGGQDGEQHPKKRAKTSGATKPIDDTSDGTSPEEHTDSGSALMHRDLTGVEETESTQFVQDHQPPSVPPQRPRPRPLRDPLWVGYHMHLLNTNCHPSC